MKRFILLATLFATTLSLSAQRNMQVWEGNTYSEFFTGDVDSVTFLLSPEGTLRTYATPQFKIENDYWFVSYDEGYHWTQLGKATGEQGPQGEKGEKGDQGEKGDKGDSMFLSVTQDTNYVYFTLADGVPIQIAKNGSSTTMQEYKYTLVDLGLPSGTLWANQNFCINTDSIYGDHFYFGSLVPNVDMKDTIYINGHKIQTGDSIAGSEYDVVTYYLGKGWYTPTANNFEELRANCTATVCYAQSPDGSIYEAIKYTSKINGRSIQIPLDITPKMVLGQRFQRWEGCYLTSTYNTNFYVAILRHYDYYNEGWTETIVYDRRSEQGGVYIDNFRPIRPVYK